MATTLGSFTLHMDTVQRLPVRLLYKGYRQSSHGPVMRTHTYICRGIQPLEAHWTLGHGDYENARNFVAGHTFRGDAVWMLWIFLPGFIDAGCHGCCPCGSEVLGDG